VLGKMFSSPTNFQGFQAGCLGKRFFSRLEQDFLTEVENETLNIAKGFLNQSTRLNSTKVTKEQRYKMELVQFYHRNGYLRQPNEARFEEGSQVYKKGYEIRFVANSEEEKVYISSLLEKTGFKHGKIYPKWKTFVLPVYGYDAMARFHEIMDEFPQLK